MEPKSFKTNEMLSLVKFEPNLVVRPGLVVLNGFEETLEQAKMIRDAFKTVTVTEDTVKANKKLLAKLNKAFNEIDEQRKAYKKNYMHPFEIVESQCKELKQIKDEAEGYIRSQIRELDEQERENKKTQLKQIWDKRVGNPKYEQYLEFLNFEDYLQSEYLNKSYSMKKAETLMAEYISRTVDDCEMIRAFCETNDHEYSEGLLLYKETRSLPTTMLKLDQRKVEKAKIEQTLEPVIEEDEEDYFQFFVKESDRERLLDLAEQNDIEIFI